MRWDDVLQIAARAGLHRGRRALSGRILPGYSSKIVEGEDLYELSAYGHASSFLFVRAGFRGASAGTRTNLDPATAPLPDNEFYCLRESAAAGEAKVWQFSNSPVSDAAMVQAQRWTNIQDLHRRMNEVEADALHQDDLADQLEHTGNGTSGAVTKVIKAMGSVGAVKFRIEPKSIAPKLCACVMSWLNPKAKDCIE